MSYKIIACDLDRTLLDREGRVSERNIKAIKELYRMGAFVVPASGRTMSEMPELLKNLPEIRYFIHSNGAAALDTQTGESMLECIKKPVAQEAFKIFKSYDTHIVFRHGGECFADSRFQTEEDYKYYNVCREHAGVVKEFAVKLDDFDERIEELDNFEVFSVYFHNLDEMDKCAERLDTLGLGYAFTHFANIEAFSKNAGKGNALKNLCTMTGTDIKDVIAVGDSDNDISMIKAAGLGLAVSNAGESVKAACDKVICSNNEHIAEFILNNIIK